jgi:hypothetical protein
VRRQDDMVLGGDKSCDWKMKANITDVYFFIGSRRILSGVGA